MAFSVILDMCVLYRAHLRDTLLRLAERGLFRALWSADSTDAADIVRQRGGYVMCVCTPPMSADASWAGPACILQGP